MGESRCTPVWGGGGVEGGGHGGRRQGWGEEWKGVEDGSGVVGRRDGMEGQGWRGEGAGETLIAEKKDLYTCAKFSD